jgi:carbon storage regulator
MIRKPAPAIRPATNLSRRIVLMLVLSRKIGERLVIGDNITVVVSRVAGNRVTLGIEAPSEVRIIRGELKAAGADGPQARPAVGYHESADALELSVPGLAK